MKRLIIFLIPVIASLAIFLAPTIAFADVTQSQINSGLCTGSNLEFSTSPNESCPDTATQSVNNLVHKAVNLLSAVVGIVAVIMIIVGGLRYITSGGNDQSVTSAKNTILYAIVGLIIVAVAQVIVHFTLKTISNS